MRIQIPDGSDILSGKSVVEANKQAQTTALGPMVTIIAAEHARLLDAERKLQCIEEAGVDNWCGYDFAMDAYYGREPGE